MASSNVTVRQKDYYIEADTDERTLTKSSKVASGSLTNAGSVNCFLNTTGGTVDTSGVTAEGIVLLPPGCTWPISQHEEVVKFKTASGSTVLLWSPEF